MGDRLGGIVRFVGRRPLVVLCAAALLALGGAALALRLEPSTATDTLVDRGSESYQATERFRQDFGDESVVVLVKGNLQRTLLTADLGRLLRLEGCLSGNVPQQGLRQLPKVCSEIAKLKAAKVVYGPATFISTAANQIGSEFQRRQTANAREAEQLARAARSASAKRGDPKPTQDRLARAARNQKQQQFQQEVIQLALRYGITDIPTIGNPGFVSSLVFATGSGRVGVPKPRFSYLFPSPRAAIVQVRLRPGLTEADRNRAIALTQRAVAAKEFAPREGGRYVVSGVPVVAQALADTVQRSIVVLLIAALFVMAATLLLVFRTQARLRLLPLALALGAAAITFGALSLAGGSLTMASIAVLPVLIGLAVDYAIQFQARFDEARARRPGDPPEEAAVVAVSAGGPTIVTAGIATAVGFLVLLLSPVPMVRGFGALLVAGIVLALGCALTAGFAALVRLSGRRAPADLPPAFPRARRAIARATDSGPAVRVREAVATRAWRALDLSLRRPRQVLAVGLAVAVVGVAADTQSDVVSDVQQLVPQDLQALKDVNELQDATGVSGEIDVTVRADDVTRPEVIAWMTRFQDSVLKAHGYSPGKSCLDKRDPPELCPALSLPAIFRTVQTTDQQQVRRLLDAVPSYFSQSVVTADRKTANLAFGIRLMPLERQKEVVDDIKERLDPPKGVQASLVGLPVLAAEANGQLASPWRRILTLLAALAAVFLVLLAVRRSRRAAAIPLIPIALAAGWSSGVVFALGLLPGPFKVELNPMSVTLGALVIAISTEFSVLLSARYRQEREAGAGPVRAIELTYASTGAAVLASGLTAIAGFLALVFSNIRMLRDFGIVTVVDLSVSLVGVMLVLPAALLWAEEHGPFTAHDFDPRRALRAAREAWYDRPDVPPSIDLAPRWPAWYGPAALLAAMALTAVVALVVSVPLGIADVELSDWGVLLGLVLLQSAALLVATLVTASFSGRPRAWHFGLRPRALRPTLLATAVALAGLAAFVAVYLLLVDGEPTSELSGRESTVALVLVAVVVTVVAPVVEELVFRGFLFRALRNRMRLVWAVLASAAVFALLHVFDPEAAEFLPLYLAVGVAAALLYERTGSLYAAIALHALYNGTVLALAVDEAAVFSLPLAAAVSLACLLAPRLARRRAHAEAAVR